MAMIFKPLVASLLISLFLVLHLVAANEMMNANPAATTTQKMDCGALCRVRCSLNSRPNLCHRACGTCCGRCSCVPAGTYGNYNSCPCYASLKTHGGRPKCP